MVKDLCAREDPYALHPPSPLRSFRSNVALETVPMLVLIDDGPFSPSSQGRSLSAFLFLLPLSLCLSPPGEIDSVMSLALFPQVVSTSLSSFQAIDGVMSLALWPQVVSQAPHNFRSSETQAACGGCFARQSVCSVISPDSGMSRTDSMNRRAGRSQRATHLPIPLWIYRQRCF